MLFFPLTKPSTYSSIILPTSILTHRHFFYMIDKEKMFCTLYFPRWKKYLVTRSFFFFVPRMSQYAPQIYLRNKTPSFTIQSDPINPGLSWNESKTYFIRLNNLCESKLVYKLGRHIARRIVNFQKITAVCKTTVLKINAFINQVVKWDNFGCVFFT